MEQDSRRDALTDALRRVGQRDATALRDVYDRTSAKLFGVCLRILGEPSEAEDVLQEVYTIVWRRAGTFDADRASPITWLATIARNRSIDRLRARPTGRLEPIEAAAKVADAGPSAEMNLQEAEDSRRLHRCLEELEDVHRAAIRAAFLDGFTYEALARRAEVPLGTMKSLDPALTAQAQGVHGAMSHEPPQTQPDDELNLPAEYVLGVLDGPTRARAAERLASDPAFRAEVEAWEQRLGPLLAEVAPAGPPPEVWDRVARSLDDQANVVPFAPRAKPWDRIGLWRAATAASLAAAAALALVVIRPAPVPPAASTILTATLASTDGKSLYVATIDRSRGGMTVVPVSAVESGGRSAELWIIPVGGKPRPVGLLVGQGAMWAPASGAVLSAARVKAELAVSLEPSGGSPTGAPTGPVIASGVVRSL